MTHSIPAQDREHIIDFSKGFLVMVMVAYHTLNYFPPAPGRLFAYLSFVTWGFIFYSGFMCGTIYFKRFTLNKKSVYKRLIIRGLKLILLFIVVNILIYVFIKSNVEYAYLNSRTVYDKFVFIFFVGGDHLTDFHVLLPIAYTLLVSAPLFSLHKFRYPVFFILIAVLILLSFIDVTTHNINCVLTGILGVFAGLLFNELRPRLYSMPIRCLGLVVLMLYLFFVIPYEPRSYLIGFVVYIIIVLYNLHSLAMLPASFNALTYSIDKLGQYSLFLYLAQIAILQILKRMPFFDFTPDSVDHVLIFVFVNVCLLVLCYLLDYLRKKINFIDKAYRFVFA